MSLFNPNTTSSEVADKYGATLVRVCPPAVLQLLLVSMCDRNKQIIESTAAEEGWRAVHHRLVDKALRAAVTTPFQLALVDTQSAVDSPQKEDYEQLAADLARSHVPLLVITGDEDDPLGEIRARQLGVWLYLPGFDGKTELDVVFREARAIHEKLAAEPQLERW